MSAFNSGELIHLLTGLNHQEGSENWCCLFKKSPAATELALGRSACELADIGQFSVAMPMWKMMNVKLATLVAAQLG